jgi:oligoribonuclease (3'-5' exoribonuclease)
MPRAMKRRSWQIELPHIGDLFAGTHCLKKAQKHTALADIIESIEELRYYREHFIKL